MCRYGTYCTFAHGENELKSWMVYNRETQEAKAQELACQKPESADMSKSEIQVLHQVSSSLRNRFHVIVRLLSNRSQMTSKCVKYKEVRYSSRTKSVVCK